MELFFDLVYVFTIIQLSHYLLEHANWLGALEYLTLFAAVWWAWNYTAWAANWVNPDHPSGRGLMIVLMGCALLMAVAAPQAFSERAELFAIAYVSMALIRAGYMGFVFRGQVMGRNYFQLGAWSAISSTPRPCTASIGRPSAHATGRWSNAPPAPRICASSSAS